MPPQVAAAPEPALRLAEVGVRFGGIAALDGVSLSVAPGEICGLIGANGAGKTTLFDVISGVRLPDAGRVELHGRPVTRWTPHRRARAGLRRTFQRVQVFGWLTIEENLLVAAEWQGGGGGVLADLVGSPTRRRRERELLHDPQVLLLDEPASGLDHGEAERFADVVEAVRTDDGTAVLLVEHDVGFVLGRCDRVVVLHLGQVLAEGLPDEIRADPRVRDAYLGAHAV